MRKNLFMVPLRFTGSQTQHAPNKQSSKFKDFSRRRKEISKTKQTKLLLTLIKPKESCPANQQSNAVPGSEK